MFIVIEKKGRDSVSVEYRNERLALMARIVPLQQIECQSSALQAGDIIVVQLIIYVIFSLLECFPFFIHSGISLSLIQKKEIKCFMLKIQTSASSVVF